MNGQLTVRLLRCGLCGTPLPVTGRSASFQCEACHNHWIISGDSLAPLQVWRAAPPEGFKGAPVFLPFWVIEADGAGIRGGIEAAIEGQPVTERAETTRQDRELSHLLARIGGGTFRIFVPAFHSANTLAYIKIGKLLTECQPSLRARRQTEPGRPVTCSLDAGEAARLVDFIFIATLPESIQRYGDFIEGLRLNTSQAPRMVELPFERRGASLRSLYGGFEISSRIADESFSAERAAR